MSLPEQTIFYSIEEAIKSYRQFSQKNINANGFDITIDQGLVLSIIHDNPGIAQKEVAARAFKDHASVTRIIELLVNQGCLKRKLHPDDRRRFKLAVTALGESTLQQIEPVVGANRKAATAGVTATEIETVKKILSKITKNCKES